MPMCATPKGSFSISSLLRQSSSPENRAEPNSSAPSPPLLDLKQCFPLMFAAPPTNKAGSAGFGLAQLIAAAAAGGKSVEMGKAPEESSQSEEDAVKKEEKDEEEEEEEEEDGMPEEDEEEDEADEKKHKALMRQKKHKMKTEDAREGAMLPEGCVVPPQLANWLFPALPASAFLHPHPSSHHPLHQQPFPLSGALPRLPPLPPPFIPSLLKFPVTFHGGAGAGPMALCAAAAAAAAAAAHHPQQHHHHHKRKGGQIRFTNEQTDILESTFENRKYLNNMERKKLAKALVLSERQVKTWFQNRRAKWRRQQPAGSEWRADGEEGDEEAMVVDQHHQHQQHPFELYLHHQHHQPNIDHD